MYAHSVSIHWFNAQYSTVVRLRRAQCCCSSILLLVIYCVLGMLGIVVSLYDKYCCLFVACTAGLNPKLLVIFSGCMYICTGIGLGVM